MFYCYVSLIPPHKLTMFQQRNHSKIQSCTGNMDQGGSWNIDLSYITLCFLVPDIKLITKDQTFKNRNCIICHVSQSSKFNFFRNIQHGTMTSLHVDNSASIKEQAAISKLWTSSHSLFIKKDVLIIFQFQIVSVKNVIQDKLKMKNISYSWHCCMFWKG